MTQESLILAVETCSRVGSVALARGPKVLAEAVFSAALRHSAEVFPTIGRLLGRFGHTADTIAQVYIAVGPGSFTGLRIAAALAKTMHLASAVEIVTVDALDVIAANLMDAPTTSAIQNTGHPGRLDRIATILDAKRGQFFVAAYERVKHDPAGPGASDDVGYAIPAPGGCFWKKRIGDALMTADELLARFAADTPLGLLGDGLLHHRDTFDAAGILLLDEACWSPRAARVHTLGWQKAQAGRFADPAALIPLYLRGPQVTLKKRT